MVDGCDKISIVTVNYNGLEDTCALAESLELYLKCDYELIVVDNGSRCDEAAAVTAKAYPHVRAVRSDVNLGFAGGNNFGIKYTSGDYILLLNNDTEVEDDSLRYMVARLDSDSRVGAVSPKIRFAFGDRNIQFAGYTPLSRVTLRNSVVGYDTPDDGTRDTHHTTPYAHGAAMMVRRDVLERVGLMSEVYFLYYEELDWSTRITEAGYEIWYEPRAVVFHKESRSTGQGSPLKVRYNVRNRMLYAWRNRRGAERVAALAYQMCVAMPKSVAVSLLRGRTDLARAAWSGCFEFFGLKNKYD